MPPAVALLTYWTIRNVVFAFSRFFPILGFFAGGRAGARSGPFLPVIELQKMNARSARAHTDIILVSYILLAKLYSPHELHSHCLFMQSGILMLFLFQRKANIAKSRPVLQISDWQTPRPSPPPPSLLLAVYVQCMCTGLNQTLLYVYSESLAALQHV